MRTIHANMKQRMAMPTTTPKTKHTEHCFDYIQTIQHAILTIMNLKSQQGKAVGRVDELVALPRRRPEIFVRVNVRPQMNLLRGLLRNVYVVSRDHLHPHVRVAHVRAGVCARAYVKGPRAEWAA